jgi:hypothetical protein
MLASVHTRPLDYRMFQFEKGSLSNFDHKIGFARTCAWWGIITAAAPPSALRWLGIARQPKRSEPIPARLRFFLHPHPAQFADQFDEFVRYSLLRHPVRRLLIVPHFHRRSPGHLVGHGRPMAPSLLKRLC